MPNPESQTQVLFEGVDFSVEKGERVAFLGPNGCGTFFFFAFTLEPRVE